MGSITLIQALAVTAELTGTNLSESAATVLVNDLSRYSEAQVLGALTRCRKELRGRLTIADVIQRLDDGRPGPEEAWAMLPRDEATTVVWTKEMSGAWGVAMPLIASGDIIAARMAFLERYRMLMQQARDQGVPVAWEVTLGHDRAARAGPILDAIDKGRLPQSVAIALLPPEEFDHRVLLLAESTSKRISAG